MVTAVVSEVDAERRYQALLVSLRREFPRLRLVQKRADPLQRVIHLVLVLLTLGRMRAYLDGYQTTLGQTLYLTADFPRLPAWQRLSTLRHEAIHLRQFSRLGFCGMALLYLLFPLPIGLAYGRMRLEREAYEETLRAIYELRGAAALCDAGQRAAIIAQFTGPAYGWMWPFPRAVARWYDDFVAAQLR